MTALRAPSVTLDVKLADTVVQTWFERDRAHVCLSRKDRDGEAGDTIVQWWDEAVGEAVEDGFLKPRDWRGTAFEYASKHGMLTPVKVEFAEGWPAIVMAFVRHTPSSERPAEQPERLEWYGEMAAEIAESVLKDRQFAKLSPRQAEVVAETLTGSLYEMAVAAESRPAPLRIETKFGPFVVEAGGDAFGDRTLTARGGMVDSGGQLLLSGRHRGVFTLTWRHNIGPESGAFKSSFGDARLDRRLHAGVLSALADAFESIDDLALAAKESEEFDRLEKILAASEKADPGSETVRQYERAYDAARVARAAARLKTVEPEREPSMSM